MPGVSISAPPPGSGMSSRCVVVCRPRLSDSRTSAVRRRSSPSRQFTSDDLPTPDDPSSATVRPSARNGRSGPIPSATPRVHRHHRRRAGDCRGFRQSRGHVGAQVALVQHHHRVGAAFHAQGQVALQPAKVEIAVQSADQEHQVDVGGDRLLVFPPPGRAPREQRAPRQHSFDDRLFRIDHARGHPIAHHRHGGAGGRVVPKGAARFGVEIAGIRDQAVLIAIGNGDARQTSDRARERRAVRAVAPRRSRFMTDNSSSCGGRRDAASGNVLRPRTARKRGGRPIPELDYRTVIGCGFKIA